VEVKVRAADEEGLRLGFEEGMRQGAALKDCRSERVRDGRFMTKGSVEEMRDLVVYGAPGKVKVWVGPGYKTPEWMIER
jgi:hypothetical protein